MPRDQSLKSRERLTAIEQSLPSSAASAMETLVLGPPLHPCVMSSAPSWCSRLDDERFLSSLAFSCVPCFVPMDACEKDPCQADGPIDCRDSMGRAVLASEIGLKPEYVAQLVVGCAGTGEAQEARALELARSGKDGELYT